MAAGWHEHWSPDRRSGALPPSHRALNALMQRGVWKGGRLERGIWKGECGKGDNGKGEYRKGENGKVEYRKGSIEMGIVQ